MQVQEKRILVINPGSTSTKIGVFHDDRSIFEKSIRHDETELQQYQTIIEYEFSYQAEQMIAKLVKEHAQVVKDLEAHGVQFNEVDRAAFERQTEPLYDGQLPGVTRAMYQQIQAELEKIRAQTQA